MSKTSIEWTDETWNPVRGCTKISPGCKHCYAETFAERWRGVPGHPYQQGFDLRLVPEKLTEPLRWKKPRRVFVNSMSDLFHEDVPFEFIAAVFGVMAACPQHTFQVLTKRPERMREWFVWAQSPRGCAVDTYVQHVADFTIGRENPGFRFPLHAVKGVYESHPWPLDNVWLGVSVENRKHGVPRIDELRATPAAVRFLSVEPLLEDLGHLDLAGIDWVIVGGESGPGARPMHPEWARSIRDQVLALRKPCLMCKDGVMPSYLHGGGSCVQCHGRGFTGPALFFKQWGEWCDPYQLPDETDRELDAVDPDSLNGDIVRVGKKAAGRELDGRTWDEMPRRA